MDYLEPKETERLLIRPLTLDDHPLLIPFYIDPRTANRFPESMRGDPKQADILIRKQLGRYLSDSFGLLAMFEKETETFVGVCGLLLQYINGIEETEIGCHLLPDHWGNGYAIEAATFFRDYAFEHNLSDNIISVAAKDSEATQKLAIRLGMELESEMTFGGRNVNLYRINKQS